MSSTSIVAPDAADGAARDGGAPAARAPAAVRVLLVTGAYYPEISAAGVQCRAVAAALRGRVDFSVLATAVDEALPATGVVDTVTVRRVHLDRRRALSKILASARLVTSLLRAARSCDVIHIHGFSQKNVPVAALARWLRKPLVLTLHTAGQDEPQAVRRRGRLAYRAFMSADLVLSVSPYLSARYGEADAGRPPVRLTPNGVDTQRFRPADPDARLALRRALGWPAAQPVVLFVGFFSRDKRPDVAFEAWRLLTAGGVAAKLVYVGATGAGYYEIDESLARRIRAEAAQLGRAADVVFTEPTNEVERYFRAADAFVLPSAREAHPLALLEAMACGLPSIATRLPGVTDVIVEDGVNGRLVPLDDAAALAGALREVLTDPAAAGLMGARARETIVEHYDVRRTAEQWLAAYHSVLTRPQ